MLVIDFLSLVTKVYRLHPSLIFWILSTFFKIVKSKQEILEVTLKATHSVPLLFLVSAFPLVVNNYGNRHWP